MTPAAQKSCSPWNLAIASCEIMVLISHIVNVSHKCIFNVWHFHKIMMQGQQANTYCAGKTLLHNTERMCRWGTKKKKNQRQDYATRRAYYTVMTRVTCNLLAITRSCFKYHTLTVGAATRHVWTHLCHQKLHSQTREKNHVKGIQIRKNFSKLRKRFDSCALIHKQYG